MIVYDVRNCHGHGNANSLLYIACFIYNFVCVLGKGVMISIICAQTLLSSFVSLLTRAGLWKGLGPRILMIGTLTALQWFIYDSVKVFFRLPRPPPPEMPESLKRKLEAKAAQ